MSTSWPIIVVISATYSVAWGTSVGRATPSLSIAWNQTDSHFVVISCHGRFSRLARLMIASSMSVMLLTSCTCSPRHSR